MVDARRSIHFTVSDEEAGRRIDQVLVAHASGWGRRAAARLFAEGAVTLDGRRARKGDTVRAGQEVVASLLEDEHPIVALPELELCVLTGDAVVVDKPWGVPSARLPTSERPDAASALVARFPEMKGVGYGPREPGLVHRLDTFTSGCLLAARSQSAFDKLRTALGDGHLVKRYLAIVRGVGLAENGEIEASLGPHPKNKKKVVVSTAGRPSVSRYRVVERRGDLALLELAVGPAYRHQVRVHLASIGHPLIGDELYGGGRSSHLSRGRHALHASYLKCDEPDLAPFEARAPLPTDMRRLLAATE